MQNPGQGCLVSNLQEQFSPGWLAYLLKVPRGTARDNTHLRPWSRWTAVTVLLRGQRLFTSNLLPHINVCRRDIRAHTHTQRMMDTGYCRSLSSHSVHLSFSVRPFLSVPTALYRLPPSLCSISGIDEINSSDFQQVWHCARELKSFQYVDFRLKPITVLRGAWPPPPAGERRLGCAWWDRDVCKTGYSLALCMFSDFAPPQPKGLKTIALCQLA